MSETVSIYLLILGDTVDFEVISKTWEGFAPLRYSHFLTIESPIFPPQNPFGLILFLPLRKWSAFVGLSKSRPSRCGRRPNCGRWSRFMEHLWWLFPSPTKKISLRYFFVLESKQLCPKAGKSNISEAHCTFPSST